MSRPSPWRLAVARRGLALAGLALLAAGLATLTGVAQTPAAAAPATASVPHSPVTILGPRLYNGTTGLYRQRSSVTASQTDSLVNQTVRVSWAHFTPSEGAPYDSQNTLYAVMVAECRGTSPTAWSQCYGAANGGGLGAVGAAGPFNTTYALTGPNGTGTVDIDVETGLENSVLGCDQRHPCSLVVVPGQGGNQVGAKFFCNDHSNDAGFTNLAAPASTFTPGSGFCSWRDRIVVPLHFSPAVAGCPLTTTQFNVAGSPMMGRAMVQWLSGLCEGNNPEAISYNSEIQEPQALQEVSSNIVDVALTTRPASADSAEGVTLPSDRHYIYAPIGVSAVSIAYWVDSPVTGQPVTNLRLNPRLVTKLLTTSYGFGDGCTPGAAPGSCDKAVTGNPVDLFGDREFTSLNRRIADPGQQFNVPLMQSGNSDMTWTLTRWIAADPAAAAFLRGQRDPWRTHVNTYYRDLRYPTDSFIGQDPFQAIQHQFNPLFPLSQVAYHMSLNWDAGTQPEKDANGNFPADSPQTPGRRALFAILDEADSAAFQFPGAAITNAAGRYVQPTNAAMAAAVAHMTSDGSGTVQADPASADPAAYPLTMLIYAAVPTAGTPPAKAAAIARFLDFAAGAGQTPGGLPGQLPSGYLPLPDALRAQTQQAATEVANQSGNASQSSHGSPTPSPIPSLSAAPTPSPSLALPPVTPSNPPITTTTVADPQQAAGTRYVLPVVLMLGGLSALAGSSALLASGRTTMLALLGRAGRAGLARSRRARSRMSRRRRP
jgi:hypothetical protein